MKGGGPSGATGAYRLVARREFVERIRDRGFQISTLVTVGILVALIVVNSLFNGGTSFDVGIGAGVDPGVGREVVALGRAQGVAVHLHDVATPDATVSSGSLDAVVTPSAIVVRSEPNALLTALIQQAVRDRRARATLEGSGLSPGTIDEALAPPPLPIRSIEPVDPHRKQNSTVAFVGVVLLYGQLFGYGVWVASGVVEEKASRVVELLLSTVRPRQLLTGKIVGIGLLGLCQLTMIGAIALVTARATGGLTVPSGAFATALIVLVWFVLGFAFYSSLFAAAGSLVPRQEELQNTMTPLSLVILASFFVAIAAVNDPDTTLARVASLLPPSAPLVMPPRIVLGQAGPLDIALAVLLSLAATAVLVPVAGRIYERAILRTGKVKIRDALREERASA